jgi:FkbM family methyltransferase
VSRAFEIEPQQRDPGGVGQSMAVSVSSAPEPNKHRLHQSAWRAWKQPLRRIAPQWLLNWREERFFRKYGEIELQLLDILCSPARDSLDIGANDGTFVLFLRGNSKTVHAFEPLPDQVATLHRKFTGSNVVIHPIALSREPGAIELHVPVVEGVPVTGCATIAPAAAAIYGERRTVSVRMDTLDNVYRGDAGFIKIDVEGHQQAVLDGAIETFRRCRPKAVVEIIEDLSPGGVGQATVFFNALGYRGFFIHRADLHPIADFSPQIFQRGENRPGLLAHPAEDRADYLYNFIFLPAESLDDDLAQIRTRLQRQAHRR